MRARTLAARALLTLSGLTGGAGARLATLSARAADLLSDAAHLVSPLATCEGCGGAVPALALEGVEVCGECSERRDFAERFDTFAAKVAARSAAHDAINVTPYTTRRSRTEEPS